MKAEKMLHSSLNHLDDLQAVVFDLDGTLVNSNGDITDCANHMLQHFGAEPIGVDAVTAMIGDGMNALVDRLLNARFGPDISDDFRRRALELYSASYHNHPSSPDIVYPGVIGLLETIRNRGLKIGLCTNKPQKPAQNVLKETGLADYFSAVVGGDVLSVRKPDGLHLSHVLALLGNIAPEHAVIIGDGINDVKTAQAIGCPVLIYRHGYAHSPVETLGANGIFNHHDELIEMLRLKTDIALTG